MTNVARKYFTAICCPFDSTGAIDEAGYRKIIRYYLQPRFVNVGGLVVTPPGEKHPRSS